MAVFNKTDLQYNDYSWKAIDGDDPRLTGRPDDVLLNRHEGYEMLAFIQHFCSSRKDTKGNPLTRLHGLQAERMIRKHLPSNIRARRDVAKWLVDNWSSYR